MNYSTVDDQTLIKLIAQAMPDALEALYQRYHRLVFSLALNVVFEKTAAEEITLDIFTKVWEKAATYQPERAQVKTWLVTLTRNRAIDWLRRQQVRVDGSSISWAQISPENTPASADNPAHATETKLRQERIRAAVAQLPPEQQQVVVLAYFKGRTHREIAELTNLPLGTVKTRLRLAMQKLHRLLFDEHMSV